VTGRGISRGRATTVECALFEAGVSVHTAGQGRVTEFVAERGMHDARFVVSTPGWPRETGWPPAVQGGASVPGYSVYADDADRVRGRVANNGEVMAALARLASSARRGFALVVARQRTAILALGEHRSAHFIDCCVELVRSLHGLRRRFLDLAGPPAARVTGERVCGVERTNYVASAVPRLRLRIDARGCWLEGGVHPQETPPAMRPLVARLCSVGRDPTIATSSDEIAVGVAGVLHDRELREFIETGRDVVAFLTAPAPAAPAGLPGVHVEQVATLRDADCQVCGSRMADDRRVLCRQCRTPHHADCWTYNGRCSTYGCGCTQQARA
jgi:hypothetical protein